MEFSIWTLFTLIAFLMGYQALKQLYGIRKELREIRKSLQVADDATYFNELTLPNRVLRMVSQLRDEVLRKN